MNYTENVKITAVGAGGNSVTLPVDNMTIRPIPYTGAEGTTVELFRGETIFVPPLGYRYEVELSWKNLSSSLPTLRSALNLWLGPDMDDVGYPKRIYIKETSPGNFDAAVYVDDVVPMITAEVMAMVFEERIRRRRATIKFVTKSPTNDLYSWITT